MVHVACYIFNVLNARNVFIQWNIKSGKISLKTTLIQFVWMRVQFHVYIPTWVVPNGWGTLVFKMINFYNFYESFLKESFVPRPWIEACGYGNVCSSLIEYAKENELFAALKNTPVALTCSWTSHGTLPDDGGRKCLSLSSSSWQGITLLERGHTPHFEILFTIFWYFSAYF